MLLGLTSFAGAEGLLEDEGLFAFTDGLSAGLLTFICGFAAPPEGFDTEGAGPFGETGRLCDDWPETLDGVFLSDEGLLCADTDDLLEDAGFDDLFTLVLRLAEREGWPERPSLLLD